MGQLHRKCFTDRTKNTDVQTLAGWMTGRGEAFPGHLWIIFAILVFLRSWKSLQRLGRWLFVKCLVCKHENMNLGSHNSCKKPGLVGSLVILILGKMTLSLVSSRLRANPVSKLDVEREEYGPL